MTSSRQPAEPGALISGASVEESVILHLFDLANHLMRLGERMAAQVGLTTQQWILLLHVGADPNFPGALPRQRSAGVLPSEVAEARGVSRATVSVLIAGLLEKGLVRTTPDASDGRKKRLVLTRAGAAIIRRLEPGRRAGNQRLLARLDPRARRQMLVGLRSCLAALELDSTKGTP